MYFVYWNVTSEACRILRLNIPVSIFYSSVIYSNSFYRFITFATSNFSVNEYLLEGKFYSFKKFRKSKMNRKYIYLVPHFSYVCIYIFRTFTCLWQNFVEHWNNLIHWLLFLKSKNKNNGNIFIWHFVRFNDILTNI